MSKLLLVHKVLLVVGLSIAVAKVHAARPNILLLVADDQGWNDVGYHNPQLRTPHIDQLVKTGVELDCHYVQPQCTPTRVALMTGRYPSRFGLHCCQASNEQAYPHGTVTMASLLQSAGYQTGMSGKWHMGSKPEWGPKHYGFDYSHGSLAGAVGMYDHRYRIDTPFVQTWHRNHEFIQEDGHVTDLTAGEAVRWIETHTDAEQPWFFYVPFHAVHTPLVEGDPHWLEVNAHIEDVERRLFAAALSHLDDAVGQMVAALDRTNQRERTLIIYTSDNGAQVNHGGSAYPPPDPKLTNFSSNKPLRGMKTDTYEGGYRVPAFVNWPSKLTPTKVTAPMHVIDWMPTLQRLLEISLDVQAGNLRWDGVDIWPVLSGESTSTATRSIYIRWGNRGQGHALRHGDWKIVKNRGKKSRWQLFNLADDPNEQHDLKATNPDVFELMMERYETERAKDAES